MPRGRKRGAVLRPRKLKKDRDRFKKTSRALKEANWFLDSIIENIPNMIFVKDADELKFVRFNRAGEDLLGYGRSDLLGKNDYDFFPKEEADFFTRKDRAVLASGKLLDIPQEPIETRKRGPRILHTKKIPIWDEKGNPVYLLGISEDITERKALEAKLNEQSKMATIGRVTAGIAHEIRNPLFGISAAAQVLASEVREKPMLVELAESMRNEVRRLENLLTDLLQYGRSRRPEFASVLPKALFAETLSFHRPLFAEKQLTIESKFEPEDAEVRVDPGQIRQLLLNLFVNAIEASETGGVIRVRSAVRRKPFAWEFTIQNRGDWIRPESLALIFEPFFTMRAEGSGLGLAISKRIVDDHGGTISAESGKESGTTFRVRIPQNGLHSVRNGR